MVGGLTAVDGQTVFVQELLACVEVAVVAVVTVVVVVVMEDR